MRHLVLIAAFVWAAGCDRDNAGPEVMPGLSGPTYGASTPQWQPGLSWSPDARFIMAERAQGGADLIEITTRLALPLAFTRSLISPLWEK